MAARSSGSSRRPGHHASLTALNREILRCRRCPRLVRWREQVAREKVRRYATEQYWGRPITGFGDPEAELLLVGLAPAAHGGNRTGRIFTGDESGRWLCRALYKAGFANQARSISRSDGLELRGCYVSAAVRCAPPANKPLAAEVHRCAPFLHQEMLLLPRLRVIVGLGALGFRAAADALRASGRAQFSRRPAFAHGIRHRLGEISLVGSYHPSQQNTFTGRLSEPMFDAIFELARQELRTGSR